MKQLSWRPLNRITMEFTKGDILQVDTESVVNIVNCVGRASGIDMME
jgi:hypothetical protein